MFFGGAVASLQGAITFHLCRLLQGGFFLFQAVFFCGETCHKCTFLSCDERKEAVGADTVVALPVSQPTRQPVKSN